MNNLFSERHLQTLLVALLFCVPGGSAQASGPMLPEPLLAAGGESVSRAPEFYYASELRILAEKYRAKFPQIKPTSANGSKATALADETDYDAAIREKVLNPPDVELARKQNKEARAFLASSPDKEARMPDEYPSEFRDYHVGALAYCRQDMDAARKAFDALLARPPAERHYRTIWALYMLARMEGDAEKTDADKVIARCREIRQVAATGFADSTDCYSASFRLEADYNDELAGELMLWKIAQIPSSEIPDNVFTDFSKEDLEAAARSPVWREITSCKLMGTASAGYVEHGAKACARWLAAVEAAEVRNPSDADRLGWIAYLAGDYAAAAKWLKMVAQPTYLSYWLQAKLELRAGHRSFALVAMKQCLRILPNQEFHNEGDQWQEEILVSTGETAYADKAMLALACGNFRESMTSFLEGKCWLDSAWVAEQLMTTTELKTFVDQQPWDLSREEQALKFEAETHESYGPLFVLGLFGYDRARIPESFYTYRLRWLLAWRMTREDRGEIALRYFPKWLCPEALTYFKSMEMGRNTKLPKPQRARAWWDAAWLARVRGLELMGTEREPDNAATSGQFDAPPTRKERLTGKYETYDYASNKSLVKLVETPATKLEKQRLLAIPQAHTQRWHYRITASDHAWSAAKLLPNGSDELKDVLQSAARWLIKMDVSVPFFKKFEDSLDLRCPGWRKKPWATGSAPWSGPLIEQLEAKDRAEQEHREAKYQAEQEQREAKYQAEQAALKQQREEADQKERQKESD